MSGDPVQRSHGHWCDAHAATIATLTAELAAERAECERLTAELQQVANEIALAESEEARREQ